MENSTEERETVGFQRTAAWCVQGVAGVEGQYLRMGLERKVRERSCRALRAKLRAENHLDLKEKQPKDRVYKNDVQTIKKRSLPRFGERFNNRSNLSQ